MHFAHINVSWKQLYESYNKFIFKWFKKKIETVRSWEEWIFG